MGHGFTLLDADSAKVTNLLFENKPFINSAITVFEISISGGTSGRLGGLKKPCFVLIIIKELKGVVMGLYTTMTF